MNKLKRGQRVSYTGYCRAYIRLSQCATKFEIAAALGMTVTRAATMLHWLAYFGVIHIARWEPRQHDRQRVMAPVYKAGAGENAPRAILSQEIAPRPFPARPSGRMPTDLMTFAAMLRALAEDTHTKLSLAAATGCNVNTARKVIDALHKSRMVYVAEFVIRENGGLGSPMFALGSRADVKKPAPATAQELWDRNNARRMAIRQQLRIQRALAA